MIVVVIDAGEADRVSEGVRAGVGLGLRGDPVAVLLTGRAVPYADGAGDPRIARGLRTLAELGRPAEAVSEEEAVRRMRAARAVEVWTSGRPSGAPIHPGRPGTVRRLQIGEAELEIWPTAPRFRRPAAGGRDAAAIDGADLVAQIFGLDGPVLVR